MTLTTSHESSNWVCGVAGVPLLVACWGLRISFPRARRPAANFHPAATLQGLAGRLTTQCKRVPHQGETRLYHCAPHGRAVARQ